MCKKCHQQPPHQPVKTTLWTLPSNIRCAVIGTCLEIAQLKRLANRFRKYTGEVCLDTDYDLHSYFVSVCGNKNPVSVYLNKLLNRQYASHIQLSQKLKSEQQIVAAWASIDRLDVRALSGYFWAFLTLRHLTDSVRDRIYGDIHMISHIAGRNEKSATYRLLEENQRLSNDNLRKDRQLSERARKLVDQGLKIDKLQLQNSHLQHANAQLKDKIAADNPGLVKYKARIAEQQVQIRRLRAQLLALERQQVSHDDDRTLGQAILGTGVADPLVLADSTCDQNCVECIQRDLCGKTILYVGGFARHRKKFERLTQAMNGRFFYHDGGLQQSDHQLDEMIRKADCVFCPVDCVSHSAMGRIKDVARQRDMDCVFLKSASISSFRREVIRYAS
jgi:hypothetical protein